MPSPAAPTPRPDPADPTFAAAATATTNRNLAIRATEAPGTTRTSKGEEFLSRLDEKLTPTTLNQVKKEGSALVRAFTQALAIPGSEKTLQIQFEELLKSSLLSSSDTSATRSKLISLVDSMAAVIATRTPGATGNAAATEKTPGDTPRARM